MSYKTIVMVIIFISLMILTRDVNAQIYLEENTTWQQNLTASQFSSLAFGDIDNDGDLDLASIGCTFYGAGCTSYIAKIYINNGTTLEENTTWQQNLTEVNYGSLAFGDIDNDGDLDLVISGCNNGGGTSQACNDGGFQSFIYINNGTTLEENTTWQQNLTKSWKGSVAFGDIDNDGDLDLIMTGQSNTGKIAKIYINNGTTLEENTTWQQNLTGIYESGVAFGDIDNDGDLDLVVTGDEGISDEVAKIYINNGTALVENSTWGQNLLVVDWSSVAFGDIDNDGDLDLTLIGHNTDDNHRIYINTGTTFQEIQKDSGDGGDLGVGVFEGSLMFGDYDSNGFLDLAVTGNEGYTYIYKNNGTVFSDAQESNLINLEKGSVAVWGDIDNDNDLDIIEIGYQEEGVNEMKVKVYVNNITTSNTAPTPPTDNFSSSYVNSKLTLSWDNGSDTETNISGLYYNLRVGTCSGCHNIVSGVYGGGDDNGYFGNMMQRKSITLNVPLNPNQTIYWSVQTIDTGLAKSNWSEEQNYTVPMDTQNPAVVVNSPVNNYNTSNTTITFNVTVWDNVNLTNVTLYGSWGGWHANETNSSGINNTEYVFVKGLSGYGDGNYVWSVRACDNSSNCIYSPNRTFRIDTVYPVVNLISPSSGSTWSSSNTVTFTYNVTDVAIRNCSLIINNEIVETNTSITTNATQTFTKTLSNGNYNWKVNCTDFVNYTNSSETRTLTVSYTPSGGPGGPGGPSIPPPSPPSVTKTWDVIESGVIETMDINKPVIGLVQIEFSVKNQANNVQITITRLEEKPASIVQNLTGRVYQYLNITQKNLNETNTEDINIKFKVNKTWILDNNINKSSIVLNRYTTKWESLKTVLLSEDDFVYYESETPGFSYFAISGEAIKPEIVCNNNSVCEPGLGENSSNCPNDCPIVEEVCVPGARQCLGNDLQECNVNGTAWITLETCEYGCSNNACNAPAPGIPIWIMQILVIVVILLIAAIMFLYYKKKSTGIFTLLS